MVYEYDAHGRITAFTDGNGNRECYHYETSFFEATCFITAEGSTYQYELDKAGRLVAVTDMDGPIPMPTTIMIYYAGKQTLWGTPPNITMMGSWIW